MNPHKTRDVAGILHFLTPQQMAEEIVRLDAALASPAEPAMDLDPEFTPTSRDALAWVLWHHQGGSSEVGQAMRFALGMGDTERMSDGQVAGAKRWAALASPAPSAGDAASGKAVDAWLWQHEETGNTGFVDAWQVENGWQAANPRLRLVRPLVFAATPPASTEPRPERVRKLEDLIGRYWSLAHAEGTEGRLHDTQDGAAQQCRQDIKEAIRALAFPEPQEPGAGKLEALTRAEVDRLVYECRQEGDDTTYALVRKVEAHRASASQAAPQPAGDLHAALIPPSAERWWGPNPGAANKDRRAGWDECRAWIQARLLKLSARHAGAALVAAAPQPLSLAHATMPMRPPSLPVALSMCREANTEVTLPTPMCWDLALYVTHLEAVLAANGIGTAQQAPEPEEDGLDSYGNPLDGSEVINCCYPDCGCDGARLCQAKNGASSAACALNIERGTWTGIGTAQKGGSK